MIAIAFDRSSQLIFSLLFTENRGASLLLRFTHRKFSLDPMLYLVWSLVLNDILEMMSSGSSMQL